MSNLFDRFSAQLRDILGEAGLKPDEARMAITMAGCAAMLFVTSVKLSLVALATMPLVLAPIGLLGMRVRRLSRDAHAVASPMGGRIALSVVSAGV